MRLSTVLRTLVAGALVSAVSAASAQAQIDLRNVYVAGFSFDVIYEVDPRSGEVSTFADASDGLDGPSGLAFDRQGNLVVSSFGTNEVFLFTGPHDGEVILDADDGLNGPFGENGLVFDDEGNLFVSNFTGEEILFFPADMGPGSVFANADNGIDKPDGLAFDLDGSLLVANRGARNILQIESNGVTNILMETDCDPFSIDVRSNGDVYYACSSGEVFIWPGGDPLLEDTLGTYGSGTNNYGIAFSSNDLALFMATDEDGDLLTINPANGDSSILVPSPEVNGGVSIASYRAVPQIEITGVCPGTVTATLTGATPEGDVAIIRSREMGESFVPAGPCAGTRLQLVDPQLERGFMANPDGTKVLTFTLDEQNCAGFIEAVDLVSCFAGDAVSVDP